MVAVRDDPAAAPPARSRRLAALAQAVPQAMGALGQLMPKGLYARALIIIIAPIVLLETVVAFVFMERHWQAVTRRLSEVTARDIAAIMDLYHQGIDEDWLAEMARDRFNFHLRILPAGKLPAAQTQPFFALLDKTLSNEIRRHVKKPHWIDTVGDSRRVEIRVKLDTAVLHVIATRSQTYASNSHIFLMWMVGSSVVLLGVAIMFLRNQIRPILRLADAADAFGKGRPVAGDFKPRGAREVRQAAQAFLEMRDRIRQHVDQRTTMLAGVSHDLRTILTRFKLELALLGEGSEARALRSDVDEMQHILEDYLAFAKGDGGEEPSRTDVRVLLAQILDESRTYETLVDLDLQRCRRDAVVWLKRQAVKRAITNLVGNATRFGTYVTIRAVTKPPILRIEVHDNGPGIPPAERVNVFRPFYRLNHGRPDDTGNTGLGLAIARDIARGHGGDIVLGDSPFGGLRATIKMPM
ncbi:MAG: ATP-binding protein [Hyphomicrobiaceae bacterium]